MADRLTARRAARTTASWVALGLALTCGGQAVAQASQAQTQTPTRDPDQDGAAEPAIVVVGSRASQQSAIDRKKRAATATDSIVADDIGSFPDRNVNEAISRVPGVALNRNDFGEGEGVAVRGNGPALTRVELDGMGVQATNSLAIDGQGSRGADLRELPAAMVKSIDVVKGSTADMTEGSIGGGIQIKTRSGLDFKKPYFTLSAGAGQNSLGKDWTPNFNGVAAGKFLGGRLGVIVSGNYSKDQNNSHAYETTTSNNRGYARLFDFDNSPEKTFTFNPATVGTDAADVAIANATAPDGSTLTPRELVSLAAGAKTKAECLTIFPNNPTGSTTQRAERILEQQTCLNQWNDYTPSLIRNFMNTQTDERYAFDGRVDYQLTDNWTVYAKGTVTNRKVHDQNRSRTPVSMFNQNLAGTFVNSTTGYPLVRSVSPTAPAGYYLFDPQYGLNNVSNNAVLGNVLNVDPASVVVDSAHNVTAMKLTNNSVTIDQIENQIDSKTRYGQIGTEFHGDRVDIEAMAGITSAETRRGDMRTSRSYAYGDAMLTLQPNGMWDIQVPDNYDETNPANYVQLKPAAAGQAAVAAGPNGPATPAYTIAQMPLTTPSFALQYSPRIGESTEKLAKIDFTYKLEGMIPFLTRFKAGAMYRDNRIQRWGAGGYTVSTAVGDFNDPAHYIPAVIVPTAQVRGTLRACEPTAGSSAAGGLSCNYGFVPSTNPLNIRSGVDTLTAQQLEDLFTKTLENSDSEYFGDLPNRGNLPAAWQGIRTDELLSALGASQFINFDCVKACMGSDGKMYDQPVQRVNETTKNLYAMFDFEQNLPWGVVFNGNVGVRGVLRNVKATGLQTITAIRVTPSYDPNNPTAAAGFVSQSFSKLINTKSSTNDWLPSVNLNFWGFNDQIVLRLYGGKTLAAPTPELLIPGGTCTIDEREILDPTGADFGCSGRLGNPSLKPFTAWNYNISLEWYPNKDTMFSVAYGKLDVKIGNPIQVTEVQYPYVGSDETDPVTGGKLADVAFLVPTYANGPGYKRDIWEFSGKTAFTFLPWFLKYTGADANLSILSSAVTSGQQDPLTGDVMLPPDESKYYVNASLWYDDGKLNLRAAYQKRSERFACITPCGGNTTDINYPGEQWTNVRLVAPGYNPGVPRFIDGTSFIDVKASYNINRNFQVFLEGRNMTRETQTISTGDYVQFADGTPRVMRVAYSGRRILGGVKIQFGGN